MTYTSNYETKPYREYRSGWGYATRPFGYGQFVNCPPAEQYLRHLDQMLKTAREPYASDDHGIDDIASVVFANQAADNAMNSYHLASLIQQRRATAKKHLADIKFRLDDCIDNRGLLRTLKMPGTEKQLMATEKQILDLERQQRDIQVHLWKDTLDLQDRLLEERSEHFATKRRISFLSGGSYGT